MSDINKNEVSSMMRHYLEIKEKYPDCIIFYRLGDFYEMFFDDAVKASKLLDLTLTGRACGLSERAPMCGVPFHAVDIYLSKLVSLGEKVAICEQLTEPNGRELVQRDVVRIVTAGTITNEELIDEKNNNFLASVYVAESASFSAAISRADITTGEFFTKNFNANGAEELFNELVKISPSEIIANEKARILLMESPIIKQGVLPKPNAFAETEFNKKTATEVLKKQLQVSDLSSFGISENDPCVCSSGALVSYLKQTQKNVLTNINSITLENNGDILMMDANAVRNLEIVRTLRDDKKYGTLLWLLDKTKTNMGARKLQSWLLSPLFDKEKIEYRQNAVEVFFDSTVARQGVAEILSGVKDIGRLTGKISNGNLAPRDCIALLNSLEVLPAVKFRLSGLRSAYVESIEERLGDFADVCDLIKAAIYDAAAEGTNFNENKKNSAVRYIKDGFNAELDELRKLGGSSKESILAIETRERERTGIKNLKVGYNRVFGYFIEVTNSFKDKVPYDFIRKQTLANAERYVTEELKLLEEKILTAEEKASQLDSKLYADIKTKLLTRVQALQQTAEAVSELDVVVSLATVARENGYVKPTILSKDGRLNIVEGRHPVVEAVSKQRFIANDCVLDGDENRTMIITGPNMAGKSTYMRQIALITLMAHVGSYVPAKSAEIPLTDKIFTRIGASDSLISDQSTFMVEMSETANILRHATKNSLIILDEIGRGTSTFDGLSIAWAVVEFVTTKLKAKTLFATHYHELTELEGVMEGVKNYKITVKEMQGSIIFLRKIMRGGANKSFGIEVAKLAGVNTEVTERAKQILQKLEASDLNGRSDCVKEGKSCAENASVRRYSEVERIIKDLDVNNLSPMQALTVLADLSEKVNKNEQN